MIGPQDLFPLLAGVLAALSCALLGNFLVLRRQSLMGDAISHSVLPGLVIAFLVSQTVNPYVMFIGAALAGIATAILIEGVKKFGRVEPGAAMGVVFSIMFALGVLLIEQTARNVDLDADCVLHGQLEFLYWLDAPSSFQAVFTLETLKAVPRQVWTLFIITVVSIALIALFFKELRLAAFDPELATSLGFSATLLHYVLMVAVALATVAAFEAVGSILVIAMLICPAASARMTSDRLLPQILWSAAFAIATGLLGYLGATLIPGAFGQDSVNAAGAMTVVAGALFLGAMLLAPKHGLLARHLIRTRLAHKIAIEDLLADLYRATEQPARTQAQRPIRARARAHTIKRAVNKGYVARTGEALALTDTGAAIASRLIRRHRLWEDYLVREAGLAPDHVHDTAEQLEHVTAAPAAGPATDPHGRPIPAKKEAGDS